MLAHRAECEHVTHPAEAGVNERGLADAQKMRCAQVEEVFKNLKGDLALRPIHHQLEARVEAHIFIAFLAYCLQVTLGWGLRDLAPGLSARAVLEKFAAWMCASPPATDGRCS